MSTSKQLPLELLVDKDNNRVVFAEADEHFVDILLSFLTLPVGTVVRILSKESSIGSMDSLYKSVEMLDACYLRAEPCRAMLLQPRNAAEARCRNLALDLDGTDHGVFYRCGSFSVHACSISPYPGGRCSCGKKLDTIIKVSLKPEGGEGAFLKGSARFMITDELKVMPVSMGASLALFDKLGIGDGSALEKKTVHVGTEEILRLLKRSLVSEMPLTDVFLQEPDGIIDTQKSVMKEVIQARAKHQKATTDAKKIKLKLFLSKENNNVVYAEAGEDFIDLLFSFLTFPLGSILKILEKTSSMGSMDNLYSSAEILSTNDDYLLSEECKDMLVNPKLPPFFGSSDQLLEIDEALPKNYLVSYNSYSVKKPEMNPRRYERGFVKGQMKFMVTDGMVVTPLSPICGVNILNKLMVPINDLEEVSASLGQIEAKNILRACLISRTALTDVFSPGLLTLLEDNWCGQFPRKSDIC